MPRPPVLKQTETYMAEVTGIGALPYIPGPSDQSMSYGEEPRKGTVRPLP